MLGALSHLKNDKPRSAKFEIQLQLFIFILQGGTLSAKGSPLDEVPSAFGYDVR